jgi:hypothetical protein
MSNHNEIQNFVHLPGNNCITTAIRSILNFYGFRYPESRIYGLAEGLGFVFRRIEDQPDPHLGGSGTGMVDAFCRNLHLSYNVAEFESDDAAMTDLKIHIDNQIPIIVQVDLIHLPYFDAKTHFAGHRVIPVGYDEENIFVADTGFLKLQSCPIANFIEARRSEFPPFAHRRRRWRLDRFSDRPFVDEMITKALYNAYRKFENHMPGYNLLQIFDLRDHLSDYRNPATIYQQIEKAGTGGGLGRKMFAEFLDQAAQIYARSIYELASALYEQSAALWREIAINARAGDLQTTPAKLEEIYQIEMRAIKIFSSFEAEDL